MQTYNSRLGQTLGDLIQAEIERLKENISDGVFEPPEYRFQCGKVSGLRKALELFDEAQTIINKD